MKKLSTFKAFFTTIKLDNCSHNVAQPYNSGLPRTDLFGISPYLHHSFSFTYCTFSPSLLSPLFVVSVSSFPYLALCLSLHLFYFVNSVRLPPLSSVYVWVSPSVPLSFSVCLLSPSFICLISQTRLPSLPHVSLPTIFRSLFSSCLCPLSICVCVLLSLHQFLAFSLALSLCISQSPLSFTVALPVSSSFHFCPRSASVLISLS